jgi:hypothetical protein
MTGPEARLRAKVVKALRSYSGWWFVTHGGQFQQGGLPDVMGCYKGYFYGLELKAPGKLHTLTERQAHALKSIKQAGGKATVVTSVQEALDFVFGNDP